MTGDKRQHRGKSSSTVSVASAKRIARRNASACLRPAAAETLERRRLLSGSYALNAIGAFNGTTPTGSVAVDAQGTVYGTTSTGGANGDGYVYKIVAGSNTITEVASFNSSDQFSGVTVGNNGVLYGTTLTGGANGTGAVYQIASGSGNITLLNSLPTSEPEEGLYGTTTVAVDANGNTFGTYTAFAEIGYNFLYEISAGGTDTAIATFNTGLITYSPLALTLDASGNLYGATQSEGSEQLFKVAAGTTSVTTLVNGLNVTPSTLSIDPAGNLYGATAPTSGNPTIPGPGSEFFEIPSASASATVLDTFPSEGSDPFESVTLGSSGNLFGTTPAGGVNSDGSVFEIPAGTTTPVTIASFNGTGNGQTPLAALAMDAGGDLYGSTTTGGTNGDGTAFKLTPLNPPQIVTNTADSGAGSLRQAILNANQQSGAATITFDIPGSGVQTISLASSLPTITNPTIIDGTSQPGYAGVPLIDVNGNGGTVTEGISITAGSSTVKGLAIGGFGDAGIILENGGGNTITGNYLGTNSAGTAADGNAISGITIEDSSNNTIGGTTAAARNVISGNNEYGIQAADGDNNVIEGNYIGTNAAGTAAIANRYAGIELDGDYDPVDHQYTLIGGTAAGAGNLISGNGVGIGFYAALNTTIEGNYIGTDVTGGLALPNSSAGIELSDDTSNTTIGGTASGAGNIIAFNGDGSAGAGGVIIGDTSAGTTQNDGEGGITTTPSPVADTVLGNRIFSNDGLGIDLADDGVTLNDSVGHVGPNNYMDFPVITSAVIGSNGLTVTGTDPEPAQTIQVFSNSAADPSGYGQGQTVLTPSSASVTSGEGGTSFTLTFPGSSFGAYVSATATDGSGNTSEFSADVAVQTKSNPAVATTPGGVVVFGGGGKLSASATISGGNNPTGTITFTLRNPSGITVYTDVVPLSGTGTYTTSTATGSSPGGYLPAGAGTYQWTAAYGGDSNNNSVSSTGTEAVSRATPTVTWAAPASIVYGTALSAAQLDATASVQGSFTYGSPLGTLLPVGKNLPLSVVFTPADATDFTNGAATTQITVTANTKLALAATSISDSGAGSLRQAILTADGNIGGANTIGFSLGSGLHTISPLTPLPPISTSTIINGAGTVQLSGSSIIGSAAGLDFTGGSSTVEGLTVNHFSTAQIELDPGSSNNIVSGNYIGTDPTGTIAAGTGAVGVLVASSGNTIGGVLTTSRNIISGNKIGVEIASGSKNLIEGNYIGTDVTGSLSLGNTLAGIQIADAASNNTVGGTLSSNINVIAFNGNGAVGSGGVVIGDANAGISGNPIPVNDAVLYDKIFSNTGLGISLGNAAVNHGVAAPTIASVTTSGTQSLITFHFTEAVGSVIRIELYSNPTNTVGQGKTFIIGGNLTVGPRVAGQSYSTFTLGIAALQGTQFLSATVTNVVSNVLTDTSVFSAPYQVN